MMRCTDYLSTHIIVDEFIVIAHFVYEEIKKKKVTN